MQYKIRKCTYINAVHSRSVSHTQYIQCWLYEHIIIMYDTLDSLEVEAVILFHDCVRSQRMSTGYLLVFIFEFSNI